MREYIYDNPKMAYWQEFEPWNKRYLEDGRMLLNLMIQREFKTFGISMGVYVGSDETVHPLTCVYEVNPKPVRRGWVDLIP